MNKEYSSYGTPKRTNRGLLTFIRRVVWPVFGQKAKLNIVEKPDDMPEQFIIVGNHPSGMDEIYCARVMYPVGISFVTNRYYTFNKTVGKFMREMGCIPKSLFVADMQSVKNTLKMKDQGATLCFFPEVRLSFDGRGQRLPASTGKFFKMLKLPVYLCHFDGSYFVKPKWAKNMRKGVIDVRVKQLYDRDGLAAVGNDELQRVLEENLKFDDYEWLKKYPDYGYRSKKFAEGLEKILYVCPHCGKKYTLTTKGNVIKCGDCGYTVRLNDRYGFDDAGFPHYYDDIGQWNRAQRDAVRKRIDEDENFELREKVKLKVPTRTGKGFVVEAGEGEVSLNAGGLTFVGVKDGKDFDLYIPMHESFYLLYGMGLGFQTFVSTKEYYAFCPDNAVKVMEWYYASEYFADRFTDAKK